MFVTERILHVGGEVREGYTRGTLLTLHSDLSGSHVSRENHTCIITQQ